MERVRVFVPPTTTDLISTIAELENPDAELQMNPMVLERVVGIENFL